MIVKKITASIKDRVANYDNEIQYLSEMIKNEDELTASVKLQVSLRESLLLANDIGLTFNPLLKLCYLEKKDGAYFLCPTYTGLISIMMNTGDLFDIYAEVVDKDDHLDIQYGDSQSLAHKKAKVQSGEVVGAYACYHTSNMVKRFEYIPIVDLLSIRELSDSYKEDRANNTTLSAWNNEFQNEMFKKTAIKRLWKYMPKTDKMLNIAKAIDLDNQVNGINFELSKQRAKIAEINNKSNMAMHQAISKLLKK